MKKGTNVQLQYKPIMTTLNIGVRGSSVSGQHVSLDEVRIYLKDNTGKIVPFPDEMTLSYQTLTYNTNQTMSNLNAVDPTSFVYKDNTTPYIRVKIPEEKRIDLGSGVILSASVPPLQYGPGHYSLYVEPIYNEATLGSNAFTLGDVSKRTVVPSTKIALATKSITVLDPTHWITQIKDDVLIKNLSIPGAHGAAMVEIKDGNYPTPSEAHRQAKQRANITEMLNAGVRAFDVRPNSQDGEPTNISYFGYPIKEYYTAAHNAFSNGRDDVLKEITDWLSKPENQKEFVVVFATREEAYKGVQTDGAEPGRKVMHYFRDNAYRADFSDGMTVGQARGKYIMIVRKDGREGDDWYFLDRNYKKGICYLDIKAPDYVNNADHNQTNWNSAGEFKSNKTYYSYRTNSLPSGGLYPYDKVNMWSERPGTGTPKTVYFLDKEVIGNQNDPTHTNPGSKVTYVTSPSLYGQNTVSKTYQQNYLYDLKKNVTIDFLEMARNSTYANDWFITFVPGHAYFDSFDASGTGVTKRETNSWAAIYRYTHQDVSDYLRLDNNGRFGIVFFDFVPGKDAAGNDEFKYPGFRIEPNPAWGNDAVSIGKQINNSLILSNFKRGLGIQ